jgi:hypothetical protein
MFKSKITTVGPDHCSGTEEVLAKAKHVLCHNHILSTKTTSQLAVLYGYCHTILLVEFSLDRTI